MVRRISLIIFMLLLQIIDVNNAIADKDQSYVSNIEMYGTSEGISAELLKKYNKRLNVLAQGMTNVLLSDPNKPNYQENYDLVKQQSDSIKNDLLNEKYFSFVDISGIFYPDDKSLYITLDVVDKRDNKIRNNFKQPPSKTLKDKSGLVTAWLEYDKKGRELYQQGEVRLEITDCPAYHCTFGFEHKELQNYLSKFNTAEEHEQELIDILTNDTDVEKRAAAASLIGHFSHPKKIVEVLIPALDDPDAKVRNDALRVIVATILKVDDPNLPVIRAPIVGEPDNRIQNDSMRFEKSSVIRTNSVGLSVPVDKIIKAINDPSAADRGKALMILYEVVKKEKKYHNDIKTNAGQTLVNLLKLKQPSNHMGAYIVLKEISGENYDQWDISAWQKWVSSS